MTFLGYPPQHQAQPQPPVAGPPASGPPVGATPAANTPAVPPAMPPQPAQPAAPAAVTPSAPAPATTMTQEKEKPASGTKSYYQFIPLWPFTNFGFSFVATYAQSALSRYITFI